MKEDFDWFLPLAPATLHILLKLAAEDLHGYGIMQEVARPRAICGDGGWVAGRGVHADCRSRD